MSSEINDQYFIIIVINNLVIFEMHSLSNRSRGRFSKVDRVAL